MQGILSVAQAGDRTILVEHLRDGRVTLHQWLVDLRTDSSIPEQEPVTITASDTQESLSGMKSWMAPGPDMFYWLEATFTP